MADVNRRMVSVLRGFASLDYKERTEVLRQIQQYQTDIDSQKRASLLKAFEKRAGVVLGPTGGGGCPCCGR